MRVAIIVLSLATAAGAQAPQKFPQERPTGGHVIGAGLHVGKAGISCDGCSTQKLSAFGGYVFLGGVLDSLNVAGIEASYMEHSETNERDTFWQVIATNRYYLAPTGA